MAQWSSDDSCNEAQQIISYETRRKRIRRRRLSHSPSNLPPATSAHRNCRSDWTIPCSGSSQAASAACCRLPLEDHARTAVFGATGGYTRLNGDAIVVTTNAPPRLSVHRAQMPFDTDCTTTIDNTLRLTALAAQSDPDAVAGQLTDLISQAPFNPGADVNGRDPSSGHCALHNACSVGSETAVKVLLAYGATPNLKTGKLGSQNQSPLHIAAAAGHWHCANALLEAGAKTQVFDYKEQTPLFLAAHAGKLPMVKLLLAYGADPNCRTVEGYTALKESVFSGNCKLTELLLDNGAAPWPCDFILLAAVRGNHAACLRLLLSRGYGLHGLSNGLPPLHWAVRLGHLECVQVIAEFDGLW